MVRAHTVTLPRLAPRCSKHVQLFFIRKQCTVSETTTGTNWNASWRRIHYTALYAASSVLLGTTLTPPLSATAVTIVLLHTIAMLSFAWFGCQVLLFVDLHGHSKKSNIFMYGVENPTDEALYMRERVIPSLLHEASPLFNLADCTFDVRYNCMYTVTSLSMRDTIRDVTFDAGTISDVTFDARYDTSRHVTS